MAGWSETGQSIPGIFADVGETGANGVIGGSGTGIALGAGRGSIPGIFKSAADALGPSLSDSKNAAGTIFCGASTVAAGTAAGFTIGFAFGSGIGKFSGAGGATCSGGLPFSIG